MEFEEILNCISEAAASDENELPSFEEVMKRAKEVLKGYPKASDDEDEFSHFAEENERLAEENKKLEKLVMAILEDNIAMSGLLEKAEKERDELKNKIDSMSGLLEKAEKDRDELKNKVGSVNVLDKDRKKYYNEATSLRKERTTYAKAIGEIYGSLEKLNKELNA